MLRLVNVARAEAGCAALRNESRLTAAAQAHSEDMARQDYFDHNSLDGRSPFDRIAATGYPSGSAENIAAGQQDAAAVVRGWLDSPGHRTNILACDSKDSGVGVARGGSYGIYWTHTFGRG